jgi:predicted GH43/DUF377 family glycosyl hydrolase
MPHLPAVERMNGGLPIISKVDRHPWENKVTFNPACALVEGESALGGIIGSLPFSADEKELLRRHDALCFLLYRAQGRTTAAFDYTRSSIGLAILTADLRLLARHTEPVIRPDMPYDDLGVEDARVTKVGDRFVMFYTAYGSGTPDNRIRIALATSTDLFHWEKHGLLKGEFNLIQNKNAMLFDRKVGGKYMMLHRPMEGKDSMAVHLAEADEISGEWTNRGMLLPPLPREGFVDTWIGGGAPPLHLKNDRFLVLYHIGNRKADRSREYDLGIAVADFSKKEIIERRIDPLMRPRTPPETSGDADLGVNNVLFVCGAYFYGGDLYFPYAGADSVVLGGKIPANELAGYTA